MDEYENFNIGYDGEDMRKSEFRAPKAAVCMPYSPKR